MLIANVPSVVLQKIGDRRVVLVDPTLGESSVEGPSQIITIPVERILALYENYIAIWNTDFLIPPSPFFRENDNSIVVVALTNVESTPWGNVFAKRVTIPSNFSAPFGHTTPEQTARLNKYQYILENAKMEAAFRTKENYDRSMTFSTGFLYAPTEAVNKFVSNLPEEEKMEIVNNVDSAMFTTVSKIPSEHLIDYPKMAAGEEVTRDKNGLICKPYGKFTKIEE